MRMFGTRFLTTCLADKFFLRVCGGLLASMGQNPFCCTKACELMGKGVRTGLMGCKLTCAQAKHCPMFRQDR